MLGKKSEPPAGIEPTTLDGWLSIFFFVKTIQILQRIVICPSIRQVLAALCVLGSVYMEVGYPSWVR